MGNGLEPGRWRFIPATAAFPLLAGPPPPAAHFKNANEERLERVYRQRLEGSSSLRPLYYDGRAIRPDWKRIAVRMGEETRMDGQGAVRSGIGNFSLARRKIIY